MLTTLLLPLSPLVLSNIIHGSDAVESAEKEIALWFPGKTEISTYTSCANTWVYE